MATRGQNRSQPTSSMPRVLMADSYENFCAEADDADSGSSSSSSRSGSESAQGSRPRPQRPKLIARKSSGTLVIPRDAPNVEMQHEEYSEDDARAMSPRRSSEDIDRLEEGARQALIEQAKQLQASLLSIVDRVETVKNEHEKLEGGNKFLQSYIGELMQTSKITSTGSSKGKGKARASK